MKCWLLDTSAFRTLRDGETGAERVAELLLLAQQGKAECLACFLDQSARKRTGRLRRQPTRQGGPGTAVAASGGTMLGLLTDSDPASPHQDGCAHARGWTLIGGSALLASHLARIPLRWAGLCHFDSKP